MKPLLRATAFTLLVGLSLFVCLVSAYKYGVLPLSDPAHVAAPGSPESKGWPLFLHVFSAMFALALGPFQFMSRVRAKAPRLHRVMGRLYLGLGIVAGGLAGLWLALHAFGGWPARTGFACLALAWLYSGLRAYRAIRGGDVRSHRRWMIRNYALTCAAVTLRLQLPAALIGGIPFAVAYPCIAWLCWVPNALVAELLLRRSSPVKGLKLSAAAAGVIGMES